MRAETIDTLAALEALVPAWTALFERVPAAAPFASPAWLVPWWRVFAPGRLASIAVWDGADLVGLAPVYIETGLEQRRLLPLGIGVSDYLDVLLDPSRESEAGRSLAAAIAASRDGWDLWSAEDAPEGASVLTLPDPPHCTVAVAPQTATPVVDLRGGLEAAVPAGKRRKWRTAQNRAARRDAVLASVDAEALPAALVDLERLHAARWRSRGEAGVLADPRVIAFHRMAAPALHAAGLLRLRTLTIDGQVAGVYYGFRRGTSAYAYLGGFDPDFAFESPGMLLMGDAIAEAANAGAKVFHFLRGQEAYKYEWGAVDRWTHCRRVEPGR